MKCITTSSLLAFTLLAGCANDDVIARFTRETDIQLRANCICPLNGTTETCLAEVESFYPSEERLSCQRRVVAMYPEAEVFLDCIADALHAFRPCFDEANRDCATASSASCGPDFTTRTNACVGPTGNAAEAWSRCMR
jgi:hypothetical protein